jgi:hypothetical protein
MAESAFFTTVLTNGFGLSCALLTLMPLATKYAVPGSANHSERAP